MGCCGGSEAKNERELPKKKEEKAALTEPLLEPAVNEPTSAETKPEPKSEPKSEPVTPSTNPDTPKPKRQPPKKTGQQNATATPAENPAATTPTPADTASVNTTPKPKRQPPKKTGTVVSVQEALSAENNSTPVVVVDEAPTENKRNTNESFESPNKVSPRAFVARRVSSQSGGRSPAANAALKVYNPNFSTNDTAVSSPTKTVSEKPLQPQPEKHNEKHNEKNVDKDDEITDAIPFDDDEIITAQAKWDYNADPADPEQISFKAGDTIFIFEQSDEWWYGDLDGKEGYFPANYLQVEKKEIKVKGTENAKIALLQQQLLSPRQ